MKLRFDQNLSHRLVGALAVEFPESAQVRALDLHTATDDTIWAFAAAKGFAIVTKDEDFANRAALRGHPPKVIWLRTGNGPWREVETVLRQHFDRISSFGADSNLACLELY